MRGEPWRIAAGRHPPKPTPTPAYERTHPPVAACVPTAEPSRRAMETNTDTHGNDRDEILTSREAGALLNVA